MVNIIIRPTALNDILDQNKLFIEISYSISKGNTMIQLIFPGRTTEIAGVEETRLNNTPREQNETPVWVEKPEKIGDVLRVTKIYTVDNPER